MPWDRGGMSTRRSCQRDAASASIVTVLRPIRSTASSPSRRPSAFEPWDERLFLAGSSLQAASVRRLKPATRWSIEGRTGSASCRTACGRVLQFALAPDSRRSGRPPGHDAGAATVERLRSPSARRFRARHRPRCRGTPPSIPAWSARVAVERHAGFSCAGRSAVP